MQRIQILDHGYLEFVGSWGSEEEIIEAARMSTGKGFLGWGGVHHFPSLREPCTQCGQFDGPCGSVGDEKLLKYLWEHAHHTPFEMAGLTIEVQAPIFVFREWHRHRVPFSYNEMSARYTPLPDVNYVPSVERLMINSGGSNKQAGTVAGAAYLDSATAEAYRLDLHIIYKNAEHLYRSALSVGVPKELARIHLPVGRYSRMRASANLRGWLAFIKLRAALSAQWEIRQYANALHDVLAEVFPRTLALFDEKKEPA